MTVFNVVYTGARLFPSPVAENIANADFTKKIEKVDADLSDIREQYLNHQLVQQATASYDGMRWVTVQFEGESLYDAFENSARYTDFSEFASSVEGKKVVAAAKAAQSKFVAKLQRNGFDFLYKYSYTVLTNGVALKVDSATYNAISKMSGVKGVYASEHYYVPKYDAVMNDANVYTTGIYDTELLKDLNGTGKSYQGEDTAVAILDTGLDSTHNAFNPDVYQAALDESGAQPRFSKDDIAGLVSEGQLNALASGAGLNDLYYNVKVPFAYDYADEDADVFPSYESHGTHVAGIVAGIDSEYTVNDNGTPEDPSDDETFVGVAPMAQLVICKVFTDDLDSEILGGADGIGILRALEDCALLGVDAINMSLGSSAGFSDEKSDAETNAVYNKIRNLGISLVCAASNDFSSGFGGGNGTNLTYNPDSATVGSPSTYTSALSVASINGQMSKYIKANGDDNQVAFITNASDGDGNRIEFVDAMYDKFSPTDRTRELKLKYVLIGGVGTNINYTSAVRNQLKDPHFNGEKVDGTIALVKRGDTTFAEKVQLAMDNGAGAVVIYNNISGTVNMSLGEVDNPVPTCLIGMDAAAPIVAAANNASRTGYITVSYDYQAGPFMSDFSSWGPVSDLSLKPEITAHGGEITSAVAGAYDVYSGTSMAAPNMAGAVAILRQYLQSNFHLEGRELNARVNQVLMSTATIARNEEGNPYSPRKQGAGLAGIYNAVISEGYITVRPNEKLYSEEDENSKDSIVGGWLDKTKLELLDDPQKKGEYKLTFTVHNTSATAQSYRVLPYVMTETVASDNRTVAEKAYMLNDLCTITYSDVVQNGIVTVPAASGSNEGIVEVTVTVSLNKGARDYIDANFVNGMYVEGFVSLENTACEKDADGVVKKGVTLGLPFLAFYGDWLKAPLFDFDVFEIADSEKDTAIDPEDKLVASANPTQIFGRYYQNLSMLPLGSYLYEQDEEEVEVYPDKDKIAVSMYDTENNRTVYELYCVYAGLLRNAAELDIVMTDTATGEVVYRDTLENVSKSYAAGGSNRGAFALLQINPSEWGMENNQTFNVTLEGRLDYKDQNGNYSPSTAEVKRPDKEDAESVLRNSFSFPFTVDYEAPQLLDYNIRFESYVENRQTKYNVYLDLEVYDNQYVQTVMPCYSVEHTTGKLGNFLALLTEYPVPVFGQKGTSTLVSLNITDYYEKYVLNQDDDNMLVIQVEDYAMNAETFSISLSRESMNYPESVTLLNDSKLSLKTQAGEPVVQRNIDGSEYNVYKLTLDKYELYNLTATTNPANTLIKSLQWKNEKDVVDLSDYYPSVTAGLYEAAGYENQIYAVAPTESGPTVLQLYSVEERRTDTDWEDYIKIYAQIEVTVNDDPSAVLPKPGTLKLKPIANGDEHVVSLDGSSASLANVEVNPGMKIQLEPYLTPWYFEYAFKYANEGAAFEYVYDKPSNEEVATVDDNGVITTLKRGSTVITVRAKDRTNYRYLSASFNLVVGEDFDVENYTLYQCYGSGRVVIPSDLNVMYLDEDCFKNNPNITELVLPSTLMEIPHYAFQGCTNLEKVVIPSKCAAIGEGAFDGCTSLQTVAFAQYEDADGNIVDGFVDANKKPVPGYFGSITIGKRAFAGTPVKTIIHPECMTTVLDEAFKGCNELESVDISKLRIAGTGVFENCAKLSSVTTTKDTAIGARMFAGCAALQSFEFFGKNIGESAFEGCATLSDFKISSTELLSIGDHALKGTAIQNITLPKGEYTLGNGAFENCTKLTTVTLADGAVFMISNESPFAGCTQFKGYEIPEGSTAYSKTTDGALYNADGTKLISLPAGVDSYSLPDKVTEIGDGALAGAAITTIGLTRVTKIGAYAFAGSGLTSVAWPESIEKIPEGAFADCKNLNEITGLDSVTEVGAHAFERCSNIKTMNLPKALTIGDFAFSFMNGNNYVTCRLTDFTAPLAQYIGESAFEGSAVKTIELPAAKSLGYAAFANMIGLEQATFGGVEEMARFAFTGSLGLKTVEFGEGTKYIAPYAFATLGITQDGAIGYAKGGLTTVNLPASLTQIHEAAFAGNTSLSNIDLSHVEEIGAEAFYMCSGLGNNTANNRFVLSAARTIGESAFMGAFASTNASTSVSLPMAEYIGDYAFAGGGVAGSEYGGIFGNTLENGRMFTGGTIESVEFPKVKVIGTFAFAGNKLQVVNIPASMNNRTYAWSDPVLDEKGREDRQRDHISPTLGAGAFAYNSTLNYFTVAADNEVFRAIDGVLYSVVPNGLVLEAYPGGKKGTQYTYESADGSVTRYSNYFMPAENTVMIGESAFEGNTILDFVHLPYTVKTIGSHAFMFAAVKHYQFDSVDAPTLIAAYDVEAVYLWWSVVNFLYEDQIGETLDPDDLDAFSMTGYYANFNTYIFLTGYGQKFLTIDMASEDIIDMQITVPKNGRGYDAAVWELYFMGADGPRINKTYNNMADDTTHAALTAFETMDTAVGEDCENIKAALTLVDKEEAKKLLALDSEIGKAVSAARAAYNAITLDDQKQLVTEQLTALLAAEAELRNARRAVGINVTISRTVTDSSSVKIRYNEGERFDPTGLALRIIYSDGSEITVNAENIEIVNPVIPAPTGDRYSVKGRYHDEFTDSDIEFDIYININASYQPTPGGDDGEVDGDAAGFPTWAIAVIVVGALAIAAGVVAILLVKKKKSGKDGGNDAAQGGAKKEAKKAKKAGKSELAEEKVDAELAEEKAEEAELVEGKADEAELVLDEEATAKKEPSEAPALEEAVLDLEEEAPIEPAEPEEPVAPEEPAEPAEPTEPEESETASEEGKKDVGEADGEGGSSDEE